MIPTIIILLGALYWLLRETDYLRVRLPVGNAKSSSDRTSGFEPENAGLNPTLATKTDTPYYWKPPEDKESHIVLCVGCRLKCREHKTERWCGWKLPARNIKAFNSTLNLAEGCNIQRALFLKSMARELKRKSTTYQPPLFNHEFIYQVRVGSHHEYVKWNHETQEYDYASKPKKGYSHRVVEDYNTNYRDCLPGKAWLKKHANDVLPEPTIEITIDGKNLSVNGNYKQGLIGGFMSEYTYKARAGKKTITAMKGQEIVNCGGGVYIAQ